MYSHATDAGWISRSHRAISPFRLIRAATIDEAVSALRQEPSATVIAGGIDLVRRMRGGDKWETLVDISSLTGLDGIEDDDGAVRIGTLATHWDVETSPLLAERLPDFQAAWKTIGNIRVRMTGTVGGNVMAGEAGYDGRVILGALGAELIFAAPGGEVSVPAADASDGYPDAGVLAAIRVPVVDGRRLAFDRSLKPVVSVAVATDGQTYSAGIGCAFPSPVFMSGSGDVDAAEISSSLPEPIDNPMGRAAYRRRMAGVLAARAWRGLNGETDPCRTSLFSCPSA